MNVLVSVAVVVLITTISISIVAIIGSQTLEQSRSFSQFGDAEQFFSQIDNAIKEVSAEGQGSSRAIQVTTRGEFEVNPSEESIQYKQGASSYFDYMSRRKTGNFVYISGGDASCSESDADRDGGIDIVVENSLLKAVFQKINRTAPQANFSTSGNILSLLEKTTMQQTAISNSSIIIDNNITTSYGSGYSELLRVGSGLPECQVHFFVNSTALMYDVYYTLYSGADFIVADVRNVVDKY